MFDQVRLCLRVQVHIEFTDGEERISLEGPTEEVEQAQAQIQEIIKDLVSAQTHTHTHTGSIQTKDPPALTSELWSFCYIGVICVKRIFKINFEVPVTSDV